MSPLDKAGIIIGILIVLASIGLYLKASATDNSDCSDVPVDGYSGGYKADCYTPLIYQQNQLIIKQNEQIIKLSAISTCGDLKNYAIPSGYMFGYFDSNEEQWNEISRCVDKLVNMTK